jgi:ankyrin repeat domain-containing protein 50
MPTALQKASLLSPELQLVQAISEYEHILSDTEKATFRSLRSGRPPETSDVMVLTAQIDRENSQRRRRCIGPRLSSFLEAVQRFSVVIDTIVGGSPSTMASAIWGVLKTALLITSDYKAYFEEISTLFMHIGRSTPRHQDLASLYPTAGMSRALCEYFTSVVNLCKQSVLFLRKGILAQFTDSVLRGFQAQFGHFQSELRIRAQDIRHEASLAAKQEQKHELGEASTFRARMSKFVAESAITRQLRNKERFLKACSTYDYLRAWKQARKAGSSGWIYAKPEFQQWRRASSGSLLLGGILGAGKTVVSANLVEHLTTTYPAPTAAICYFFCRYDEAESLEIGTIIGALARQMLSHAAPDVFDALQHWDVLPHLGYLRTWDYLMTLLPLNKTTGSYFIVVDGLDECDEMSARYILMRLATLASMENFHVFCSARPDMARRLHLPVLHPEYRLSMEVQTDLVPFIEAELEERCRQGRLSLGRPDMISTIRDAIVNGSHGM